MIIDHLFSHYTDKIIMLNPTYSWIIDQYWWFKQESLRRSPRHVSEQDDVCVFNEPTCCVDDVEEGSLVGSPSLAAVLPNSRQPVALWDSALGSLGLLENRLLKDRQKEQAWSLSLSWNHRELVDPDS